MVRVNKRRRFNKSMKEKAEKRRLPIGPSGLEERSRVRREAFTRSDWLMALAPFASILFAAIKRYFSLLFLSSPFPEK